MSEVVGVDSNGEAHIKTRTASEPLPTLTALSSHKKGKCPRNLF